MTDTSDRQDIPLWDPALAALVAEESHNLKRGLTLEDFRRLADEHAIRFDDIVVSVLELTAAGRWRFEPASGEGPVINRESVDQLKNRGRLKENDLNEFQGIWRPA